MHSALLQQTLLKGRTLKCACFAGAAQVSEACQDLLRRMMTSDPTKRISVQVGCTAMRAQRAAEHFGCCAVSSFSAASLDVVQMLTDVRHRRAASCCRASCSTPGSCTTCRRARWTSTPSSSPPTPSGMPPASCGSPAAAVPQLSGPLLSSCTAPVGLHVLHDAPCVSKRCASSWLTSCAGTAAAGRRRRRSWSW